MSFAQRLQASWYDPRGGGLLTLALLDASWLYRGMVALRRMLYTSGALSSERLPVPVIVVGNVIAGGAGKTPIVIEVARLLEQNGIVCGIVSRGYGRRAKHVQEVRADTPISDSGDEPALIRSAQNAPVFVASERVEAALALLQAYPHTQVILSDDGLQHLALQRDIEICVFDERGVGNGRLLPAGPLREPWPREVDFVLHRGGMEGGFAVHRRLSDFARASDGSRIALRDLAGQSLTALAGIAQPERFFAMLGEAGLVLGETMALPDHDDFMGLSGRFRESQILLCTEKDAVKLWRMPLAQHCRVLAVPLEVTLPEPLCQALIEKLSSRLSMAAP
jgi:tetraacyldisaccharide 4'-kinase